VHSGTSEHGLLKLIGIPTLPSPKRKCPKVTNKLASKKTTNDIKKIRLIHHSGTFEQKQQTTHHDLLPNWDYQILGLKT
jgi:hypothetical protein